MIFNSSQFICFFILICFLYYLIPSRIRKEYLLIISYVFYAFWNPKFLLLLCGITVITYFGAILIRKSKRSALLYLLILAVFLPLFFFKYYSFTLTQLENVMRLAGIRTSLQKPDVILPVGISFFTFQAAGYLIDVWRETVPVEKNFLSYALFLSFFPQQASGPIGRAGQLLPQITDGGFALGRVFLHPLELGDDILTLPPGLLQDALRVLQSEARQGLRQTRL